jgi:hypothetical protein
MSTFEFSQEHQFDISNHSFEYQSDNKIVVRDADAVIQLECDLNSESIAVMGKIEADAKYFCFGAVTFSGAKFSKSISIDENKSQAEFKPVDLDFIGSDDLRDVRLSHHHYHLNGIPIQLDSDGVFLNILCPGSESDSWYEYH